MFNIDILNFNFVTKCNIFYPEKLLFIILFKDSAMKFAYRLHKNMSLNVKDHITYIYTNFRKYYYIQYIIIVSLYLQLSLLVIHNHQFFNLMI